MRTLIQSGQECCPETKLSNSSKPDRLLTKSNDKCPVHLCDGSGWIQYEKYVDDYKDYALYGEPCKCAGGSYERQQFRKVRSGMPFEFMDKSGKDFEWKRYRTDTTGVRQIVNAFCTNFQKFRDAGKGLYIYSKTKGSGKTMLACCMCNEIIRKGGISVKFTTVPDFIALVGEEFKNERGEESEVKNITNCTLLVLDDIGSVKQKSWSDENLFKLINTRMSNKKPIVFTSNIPMEQLNVDERIQDRICKISIPLNMPEEAIRTQQAQKENVAFLQDILSQ